MKKKTDEKGRKENTGLRRMIWEEMIDRKRGESKQSKKTDGKGKKEQMKTENGDKDG